MATPRMKPPKTAWMPTASIAHALSMNRIRTTPKTPGPTPPSRSAIRPRGARSRGPKVIMTRAKAPPPAIATTATIGPAPKLARTIANTHHAPASSMAPAARDSDPSLDPLRPRS